MTQPAFTPYFFAFMYGAEFILSPMGLVLLAGAITFILALFEGFRNRARESRTAPREWQKLTSTLSKSGPRSQDNPGRSTTEPENPEILEALGLPEEADISEDVEVGHMDAPLTGERDRDECVEKPDFEHRRKRWMRFKPTGFEIRVAKLFRESGFNSNLTKPVGDGGIDVFVSDAHHKVIVECKRHKNPIGVGVARQLYGVLHAGNADAAVLICPYSFTSGVFRFARGKNIYLIDAYGLEKLSDDAYRNDVRLRQLGLFGLLDEIESRVETDWVRPV